MEGELRIPGRTSPQWQADDPEPRAGARHGGALAVHGDRLFAGNSNVATGSAEYISVYRYEIDSDRWVLEQTIADPSDADVSGFGTVVAVGNGYLAAGAPDAFAWSEDGRLFRGSVFLFSPDSETGGYVFRQRLAPPGAPAERTGFGRTLGFVQTDGALVLMVAEADNDGGLVHIYTHEAHAGTFVLRQTLGETGTTAFGSTLAVAENLAAVGALDGDQHNNPAIYVFERNHETEIWKRTGKLVLDAAGGHDFSAVTLAICDDEILVGMPTENGASKAPGRVHRFAREENLWVAQVDIDTVEKTWGIVRRFGQTLAVSGPHLFVSAARGAEGANDETVVYRFHRTEAGWAESQVFCAGDSTGTASPTAVAVNDEFVWIGTPDSTASGLAHSGGVHGFRLDSGPELHADTYRDFESALAMKHPTTYSPFDDADRDGVANLIAFFVAKDSTVPVLPTNGRIVCGGNAGFHLQFQRRKDLGSARFQIQTSSDLREWRDLCEPAFAPSIDHGDTWLQSVYLEEKADAGGALFARIVVTVP